MREWLRSFGVLVCVLGFWLAFYRLASADAIQPLGSQSLSGGGVTPVTSIEVRGQDGVAINGTENTSVTAAYFLIDLGPTITVNMVQANPASGLTLKGSVTNPIVVVDSTHQFFATNGFITNLFTDIIGAVTPAGIVQVQNNAGLSVSFVGGANQSTFFAGTGRLNLNVTTAAGGLVLNTGDWYGADLAYLTTVNVTRLNAEGPTGTVSTTIIQAQEGFVTTMNTSTTRADVVESETANTTLTLRGQGTGGVSVGTEPFSFANAADGGDAVGDLLIRQVDRYRRFGIGASNTVFGVNSAGVQVYQKATGDQIATVPNVVTNVNGGTNLQLQATGDLLINSGANDVFIDDTDEFHSSHNTGNISAFEINETLGIALATDTRTNTTTFISTAGVMQVNVDGSGVFSIAVGDVLGVNAIQTTSNNTTLTMQGNGNGGVSVGTEPFDFANLGAGSDADGDIAVRIGGTYKRLAIGSPGQMLVVSALTLPSWASGTFSGDMDTTTNKALSNTGTSEGGAVAVRDTQGLVIESSTGTNPVTLTAVANSTVAVSGSALVTVELATPTVKVSMTEYQVTPSAMVSGDTQRTTTTAMQFHDGNVTRTYQLDNTTQDRNLLINGDFSINQRNAAVALTLTANTTVLNLDRWRINIGVGGAGSVARVAHTIGQTDVPGNPKHMLQWAQTTGGTGAPFITNVSRVMISQPIEDVRRTSGQILAVTGWCKVASGTLTVTPTLVQRFGNSGSINVAIIGTPVTVSTNFTQTISQTFTLPSVSGKTINAGDCLDFMLLAPVSTTFTLSMSDFCVEVSPTLTQRYPRRAITTEIALAQRYHNKTFDMEQQELANAGVVGAVAQRSWVTNGSLSQPYPFNTLMRATPTVTTFNPTGAGVNWSANPASPVMQLDAAGPGFAGIGSTAANNFAGNLYYIHVVCDAELNP